MTANACNAIDRYFTEFLTAKLHQPLLPKLQKLSAVFRIELLNDPVVIRTLTIENGVLTSVENDSASAQCGYTLRHETFALIIAGKLSPQAAFFKREVDIDGDIALGLKLATVLAEFFKNHPWSA